MIFMGWWGLKIDEDGLVPNDNEEDEVALVNGICDGSFGGDDELREFVEGGVVASISRSSLLRSMEMVGVLMEILGFLVMWVMEACMDHIFKGVLKLKMRGTCKKTLSWKML